jgi:hypothetical protein
MRYKVLLFETNSIVSFFNKLGSMDEIRKRSIPSTLSNSELVLKGVLVLLFQIPLFRNLQYLLRKNNFFDILLRNFVSIFQNIV